MPTEPTPITNITTPVPVTSDPDTFDARADMAWTELPVAIDGINDAAEITYDNAVEAAESAQTAQDEAATATAAANAAIFSSGYARRSAANLGVFAGAKAVTGLNSPTAALFADGDDAILIDAENTERQMWGSVSNANMPAGTMTVTVAAGDFSGSGTNDNWLVMHRAFARLLGASTFEVLAAETNIMGITPKTMRDVVAPYVLTDGATVTPDTRNGRFFRWTLGGNRLLDTIINAYVGLVFEVEFIQDGTGNRVLAWASGVYKRQGGLPVLPTAAGAKAYLRCRVTAVDGSFNATEIVCTFVKAPTN